MPTPINYNNPDFLGGDTPITSHDLRQALIAGYKQALEDMSKALSTPIETLYEYAKVPFGVDDTIDAGLVDTYNEIWQILTIPEEE